MDLQTFFDHFGIRENPFRAEEAREDHVFQRIAGSGSTNAHPEFEKVVGDIERSSTSVVFGEKGAGKTAFRLQIGQRIREHNMASPERKVFFVPMDDLNPTLDRLGAHAGVSVTSSAKDITRAIGRINLADHLDALLHSGVTLLEDALLGDLGAREKLALGSEAERRMRTAPINMKHDLLLLQTLYGREDAQGERRRALRSFVRPPLYRAKLAWTGFLFVGWLPAAGVLYAMTQLTESSRAGDLGQFFMALFAAFLAIWLLVMVNVFLLGRMLMTPSVRRSAHALRVVGKTKEELRAGLSSLPPGARTHSVMPVGTNDAQRYELLDRFFRILGRLGFASILVVYDRIDEPTLVKGDAERMRAVVWPLLNNKFLQLEHVGVKLLLPIELRHELFRESSDFFQTARMDKQNMVERLSWSGAMLFDLCNARLNVCREDDSAGEMSIVSLFDETVSRQDVVEALDQMRHPRDAFKLMHQCISEHCSHVTTDEGAIRIPRHVLESVKRREAERVQQFGRGVRPA
ncbi:MAG: hypothetical protein AAGB34_11375 [Planctomycetota bacterium]